MSHPTYMWDGRRGAPQGTPCPRCGRNRQWGQTVLCTVCRDEKRAARLAVTPPEDTDTTTTETDNE